MKLVHSYNYNKYQANLKGLQLMRRSVHFCICTSIRLHNTYTLMDFFDEVSQMKEGDTFYVVPCQCGLYRSDTLEGILQTCIKKESMATKTYREEYRPKWYDGFCIKRTRHYYTLRCLDYIG